MEKLKLLMAQTKCSITLTINNHRDYYMSVEEYIEELNEENRLEIDAEVYEKMKELDTIIELQWYPRSPGSFHILHHYDIDKILHEALN